jgi:hypothetical protein
MGPCGRGLPLSAFAAPGIEEIHVFVLNKTMRIREELIVGGATSK